MFTQHNGLFLDAFTVEEIKNDTPEVWARALGSQPKTQVQKASAGTGIGKRAYELISTGMSNAEIVRQIRSEFPTAQTTLNCINWYRNKARKSIN